MPLLDHLLSNGEAAGMLLAALGLAIFLCWPIGQEVHAWIVNRRLGRQIYRDHVKWEARRAARMREVLR
jgi:hypothetical protein